MRNNDDPKSDQSRPERQPARDRRDGAERQSEVVGFPIRRRAAADRLSGPDEGDPGPSAA